MSKYLAVFVAVVALVTAGIIFFATRGGVSTVPEETTKTPSTKTSPPAFNIEDKIESTDNPPGRSMVVAQAILSRPGFIVIHKSTNSLPGEVVAVSNLMGAGEVSFVTVPLTFSTSLGEEYFAMLHWDDGNGKFDSPTIDTPAFIGNTVVAERFSIRER